MGLHTLRERLDDFGIQLRHTGSHLWLRCRGGPDGWAADRATFAGHREAVRVERGGWPDDWDHSVDEDIWLAR